MLLNYGLILDNQPLLVIERQDRDKYIDMEAKQDISSLMDYAKEKLSQERQDMENFYQTEERQVIFEKQQWEKIKNGELKLPHN